MLHQDIHTGDVVCWPTNLGWMMGPWLIFASLLNGASIALYYGAPTGRGFGEFIKYHFHQKRKRKEIYPLTT